MVGHGLGQQVGQISKKVGKVATNSGNMLKNEPQQEINGNVLGLKKVGRAVRKVGRVAMKSGVGDFIIDEDVGT